MIQYFLNGKEFNPDEEVAIGTAVQVATTMAKGRKPVLTPRRSIYDQHWDKRTRSR